MPPRPLRLLILGTGHMAQDHARAYAAMPGVEMVAACDIRPEVLAGFAATHGIGQRFDSLDAALAWGDFDAASNVTPDPVHHPTTMALLAAGKPVLCEKPLATSAPLAREMAAAARGMVNVVNLTYRKVPAVIRAAAMVAEGVLGPLRHFEASYLQSWLTQPAWGDWRTEPRWLWRLSTAHGSAGCLGDIGIHILDLATFVAGEPLTDIGCRLTTFPKAEGDRIGAYPLDANDAFTMQARMASGATGTIAATRMATGHFNDLTLRLYGLRGGLEVSFVKGVSRLRACLGGDIARPDWAEIACPPVPTNYDRFIAALRGSPAPVPDFERGAELQGWLDLAARSDAEGARLLATR